MTNEQFDALVKLIDARAKLAVAEAFGDLTEAMRNDAWQDEQIARGLLVRESSK